MIYLTIWRRLPSRVRDALRTEYPILFLVGVSLSIAQFVMIRDFVTVLYGEELVITLVASAFFAALSVGYLIGSRLSIQAFRRLFVAALFLHLTFPFSYRYLAAGFSAWDWGGVWYLALLFVYALIFSSMFATFLPRLIDHRGRVEDRSSSLKPFYTFELAGFMVGFIIVVSTWNKPLMPLLVSYWAILCVLLHMALGRKALTAGYAGIALVVVFFLPGLDMHSTALLYELKHGKEDPEVLLSINSPYQKVEVIEDINGGRRLYLDGLENLNSLDLEALNYYIAVLPASLIHPDHALLIGNGTLSSVPKLYPLSKRLTSVELDRGVIEAGRRFFTDPDLLSGLNRWTLNVDDGRHFLRNTGDTYDLIVMDVPSPLTIQEAHLHTVEFYQLAQSRLGENGVIAVQISGELRRNNRTPAQVVAALRRVFSEVMVVHSEVADRGFAYASMSLPFTSEDLRERSRSYETSIEIIEPYEIAYYLEEATPLSLDRMDLVLKRGWERFNDRYFDDD